MLFKITRYLSISEVAISITLGCFLIMQQLLQKLYLQLDILDVAIPNKRFVYQDKVGPESDFGDGQLVKLIEFNLQGG